MWEGFRTAAQKSAGDLDSWLSKLLDREGWGEEPGSSLVRPTGKKPPPRMEEELGEEGGGKKLRLMTEEESREGFVRHAQKVAQDRPILFGESRLLTL